MASSRVKIYGLWFLLYLFHFLQKYSCIDVKTLQGFLYCKITKKKVKLTKF